MSIQNKLTKLSRRHLVRIISYSLAVMVALGGAGVYGYAIAVKYRTQLEHTYQRGLEDLSNNLNNINVQLEKGLYAGTASQLSYVAAFLWRESGAAKSALSQLPSSDEELTNVNRFLSQVGDYSLTLSKKSIGGEKLSKEEQENFLSLSDTAVNLSSKINEMRSMYEDGRLWIGEVERAIEDSDEPVAASNEDNFGVSLMDMENSLIDASHLIYDGPFSDHMLNVDPLMTKSAKDVSRTDAKVIASKYLNAPASVIGDDGDEESTMPSYGFYYGDTSISVTKQGGYCVYLRNPRDISSETLSQEQAVEKAQQFLKSTGYDYFEESYYMTDEGVCVINFAYKDGDTICYTDLIKVGVALDNGEIVFYEARGYLMNHKQRNIPKPAHTEEEAKAVLSTALKVVSTGYALIPSGGNKELACYEFRCEGLRGEDILVYVNTQNLAEEQILILLKTDGGTMTR